MFRTAQGTVELVDTKQGVSFHFNIYTKKSEAMTHHVGITDKG